MSVRLNDRRAIALAAFLFAGGVVGHGLPALLPLMRAMTPWVLLLCGAAALAASARDQGVVVLAWAAAASAATFAVEVAGVATGVVFGAYSYGDALGVRVFGVPPIIGFNWALVVLGLVRGVRRLFPTTPPLFGALLAGVLAVLFDWILEPLAVRLGYWSWSGIAVPLRNYAAWFCIASLCALPAFSFRRAPESLFPSAYVLIEALFFAAARLALSFI